MNFRTFGWVACSLVAFPWSAQAHERCVPLEGQTNFRDVGGYKSKTGESVRRQVVFRSGRLPGLTQSDLEQLDKLEIGTVVNFLTPEEIEASGKNQLPSDAKEILVPIESEGGLVSQVLEARKTGDFSKIPPDLNPQIHRLLVNDARQQYATLMREIIQADEHWFFIARTGFIGRVPQLQFCSGHLASLGKRSGRITCYPILVANRKSLDDLNTLTTWLPRNGGSHRSKWT